MDAIKEIKSLVNSLNKASDAYYNSGNPIMSDIEFDSMLEHLKALENKTGIIMANSPTHNPGTQVVNEINKITHEHLMLSLDKVHTIKEIEKFMGDNNCVVSVKLDGLSLSATYIEGVLSRLETRGNGSEGSDVMIHASSITNLPSYINVKGKYVIDGECIIPYDVFDKYNSTLPEDKRYANPRNLASGTLSLLDNSISKERGLQFWAWNAIESDDKSNSMFNNLSQAMRLGFDVTPMFIIDSESDIDNSLSVIKSLAENKHLPMDGCVITMDDIDYGESLGRTDKFFRNAIAYKYEDDRVPAKLIDIEWTMGKTGALTPTIVTEPVQIEGTTVTRASVHNVSIFKQLHFTKGCTCHLYKANQIIPQCDFADDDGIEEFEIPKVCPVCGAATEIVRPNQTEILICTNSNCNGKLLGKLSHFVSKTCINIDGLSDATLELLYSNGYINSYKDIYNLKNTDIMDRKISGLGKKSKEKLLQAIENSKETELYRFIAALNIPGVGVSSSKDIAKKIIASAIKKDFGGCKYGDLNSWFMETIDSKGNEYWKSIEGIGDKTATEIVKFFKENWNIINELIDEFIFKFEENSNSVLSLGNNDLEGKTFCITGSLNVLDNRDAFILLVEKHNGKYMSGVSSKLDYLVINDLNSTSSKANKARQLGVKLINEQEFIDMINKTK